MTDGWFGLTDGGCGMLLYVSGVIAVVGVFCLFSCDMTRL